MENPLNDTPDTAIILLADLAGCVVLVGRDEPETPAYLREALDGKFSVHHDDDDAFRVGFNAAIYNQDVAGLDAVLVHRVPDDGEDTGGVWMLDEASDQVNLFVQVVVHRHRATCGHGCIPYWQ